MFRLFKRTAKENILKGYKNLLRGQRNNKDEITNEQRNYDRILKRLENKHNSKIDALLIEKAHIEMDLKNVKDFIQKTNNSNE